ncbi:magnesium transporter MgtE N-terminal domain-containing protein [Oceanibacterium hippocampi]|uniref:Magnesium transporter MgtE n=1 Tax=Oceanibacterium hippocampi TaxID=745714 RepID=A0A1Y5TJA8_9PROT|nr:CBS domain-containing protein [Oceanibacterium hippocampi]SLN63247.1 Magnesium transporter MgtE [Oceanibacterium hippocampi]
MSGRDALAELFLERHLQDAAAVAEECDAEAIAAFAAELPEDRAVDLFSTLSAGVAAAAMEHVDDRLAVAFLGAMARRKAADILRRIAPERRASLLQGMSTATRLQLEVILLQPRHRVGAWMESHPMALPQTASVAVARRRLQRHPTTVSEIYVVDAGQKLVGVVPLSRLLTAGDEALLPAVAIPAKRTLRASASIESALEEPAWADLDTLPVVDRDGKLVGSVRHAALRVASEQPRAAGNDEDGGDYLLLANNVYVGLAAVLAASMAKAQVEPPSPPEEGTAR